MNQRGTNSTNRTVTLTNASGNRGVLVLTVPGDPKAPPTNNNNGISNQGAATLIVMCCVLTIIMLFCCLAAPGIRDLCKRYVFRQCVIDDPDVNNVWNRRQGLQTEHELVSEKPRRSSRSSQSRRHSSSHRRQP